LELAQIGTAMSRIVRYFAIAGATIPFLLMFFKYIELLVDINKVPYAIMYGLYLWPSWVLLISEGDTFTLHSILKLSVSIFINVVLYAVVGLLIAGALKSARYLSHGRNS
jgi:hypothetical protein